MKSGTVLRWHLLQREHVTGSVNKHVYVCSHGGRCCEVDSLLLCTRYHIVIIRVYFWWS